MIPNVCKYMYIGDQYINLYSSFHYFCKQTLEIYLRVSFPTFKDVFYTKMFKSTIYLDDLLYHRKEFSSILYLFNLIENKKTSNAMCGASQLSTRIIKRKHYQRRSFI